MRNRMVGLAASAAVVCFLSFAPSAAVGAAGRSRAAVPHGGGGGGHAAPAGTATRGGVPPHGTANGTARYGYGYYGGHGYWGGYYPYYPYWGWGAYWGYPYWGVGWSVSWGWPYYYGPYYGGGYYGPAYTFDGPPPHPSGPAVVYTDINPKKAQVVLDGQLVGSAKDFSGRWDELKIDPGHHTVTFRQEGYKSLTYEIEAQAGASYHLTETMAAGNGDDHRVIAAPAEHHAEEKPVAAEGNGNAPAAAPPHDAGVARGLIRIRVTPEDASVYLDGEFLGMGSELARLHGAIPVATGEHKLEIVRPGYASDVRTVRVGDDGNAAQVEVVLSREHAP